MNNIEKSVAEIIRKRISETGRITFEEFMDTALYHPSLGYYTSDRVRIGMDGDFYTSTDVHRAFGGCIMRQIEEMGLILNHSPLKIVEVGAGKGLLCADILLTAKEKVPAFFETIRYVIVEKSPDFVDRQKEHLESLGLSDRVSWASDIKEALPDGTGIVLSNELFDALPVHKVKFINGHWSETYVTLKNNKFVEIYDSPSSIELADFLSGLKGDFEEGYSTEVNLRSIKFIREIGKNLNRGFVITIDYGYPRSLLYSPERNRGTLMCYYRHQPLEDSYINIGEQDITTHIDFTSLAQYGKEVGLDVCGFTDQSYFLMGCGIEDDFQQIEEMTGNSISAFSSNTALKRLLMPGGMGSIFKVLIQHKGMEKPRLRGFSFKNMEKYLGL